MRQYVRVTLLMFGLAALTLALNRLTRPDLAIVAFVLKVLLVANFVRYVNTLRLVALTLVLGAGMISVYAFWLGDINVYLQQFGN